MLKLQIYITNDCWSCEESRRIAVDTQAQFQDVEVTLTELDQEESPPNVFAAPTYVLDGKVISLGNPRIEELWAQLAQKRAKMSENGGNN
jgi:hypothetical protein